MPSKADALIEEARHAALDVLRHNAHGPYRGLPRTAGWGYPEPYTRDLMIASFGILVSRDAQLAAGLRRVLITLGRNQSPHGHIPSLVHDPGDRSASDTTPLFLIALGLFRKAHGEPLFLEEQARKALRWLVYQSPDDSSMVAQQPTSDWRDEQWVLGFGLYVNTLVYAALRLHGEHERAEMLRSLMNRLDVRGERRHRHVHEGLVVRHKPYYAFWAHKVDNNERLDLLGNSLAVLFGIASPSRGHNLVGWTETECDALRERGDIVGELPPCLFPYVRPGDPDWRPRYERFNQPGDYHNGGVWPFVCGFYIAALVAVGRQRLAKQKLAALAALVRPREASVAFGFNEWIRAQDGTPCGQDWQTWSASMYIYAEAAVRRGVVPLLDAVRKATIPDKSTESA